LGYKGDYWGCLERMCKGLEMVDFLKGEEGSFIHISQYITEEGTNLILIEWILDNTAKYKDRNFLLTD
jgi:hypothetical protein